MAITLNLYSFTKRENSTKQPSGSSVSFSCTMIDNTSLMTPTFKISAAANPIGYNYAYVSDFNRYYFITDISTYQNFWYISCTCDVLATYKTAIGTGSHYVLRSASSYDGYVTDTVYPAKVNMSSALEKGDNDPFSWSIAHSYVVGIVGYAPSFDSQIGSVTYYHMDDYALYAFMYYLMHDVTQWSNILSAEYDPGVQEALLNPMQYITTCVCIPVTPPNATTALSKIHFGYYDCDVAIGTHIAPLEVDNSYLTETSIIDIPKHPQAATRGAYLNGEPYTSLTCHVGPFGDIQLDPGALVDCTQVAVKCFIDKIQGMCRLMIYGVENPDCILHTSTAQIGVDINLSQVLRNPLDSSTSYNNGALNAAGNIATGKVLSGVSTFFQTMDSYTRLKYPTVSGKGTAGSFISYFDDYSVYITAKFCEIVDENLAEIGRPLCQTKQINTLSGYILCQGADCQITGTQEEAEKVNGYMNTGFYYE